MSTREKDALVAETFFGKVVTKDEYAPTGKGFVKYEALYYLESHNTVPAFTSDLMAAWSVVEKLKLEGDSIEIFTFTTKIHGPEETKIRISGRLRAEGDLLVPEAICLAALRANGVEIND